VRSHALAVTLGFVVASAAPCRAQPGDPRPPPAPLRWNEDWPRFRPIEGASSALLGGLTVYLLFESGEAPSWKGTNRFDEWLRSGVRFSGDRGRAIAGRVSDFGVLGLLTHAMVVDPAVTWGARHSGDVAFQTFAINAQSIVVSLALQTLVTDFAGRERPFGRLCLGELSSSPMCKGSGRYRSFFSGHTVMAFTSAALVCTTHGNIPIYGSPWDMVACAGAVSLATTVGAMRMAADRHYASDVLVGASIGFLSGVGLPWLLHYRGGVDKSGNAVASARQGISVPLGSVSGQF
jgi:membrane-associated phospholipid phosphatase